MSNAIVKKRSIAVILCAALLLLTWVMLRPGTRISLGTRPANSIPAEPGGNSSLRNVQAPPSTLFVSKPQPRASLISWKDVPPRIAYFALPVGRFNQISRFLVSITHNHILGKLGSDEEMGLPLGIADLRRRGIGLVMAIDHSLLRSLPNVKWADGFYSYPDEYFPSPTVDSLSIDDRGQFESALKKLLSSDLSNVLSGIPPQFKDPGLSEGIRARAILLLGSVSKSPDTMDFLRTQFSATSDSDRASISAALAFMGDAHSASSILESDPSSNVKIRLLSALSNGHGKWWGAVTGEEVSLRCAAHTSIARSLDTQIVQMSLDHTDPSLQRAAILALAYRQDNPAVHSAIVTHLSHPLDSELTFDLLRSGPFLRSTPEMISVLTKQLASSSNCVRTAALLCLGSMDEPSVIDTIIPYLNASDPKVRDIAAAALADVGRLNQERSIAALKAASDRWKEYRLFPAVISRRIQQIKRPSTPAKEMTEWLKLNPDHILH